MKLEEQTFGTPCITGKKHSFPMFDPKIYGNEVYINLLKFFTFLSLKPKQFAALLKFLVLNLNGTKTLMGFIRQHAGFCRTQKLKLPGLEIIRRVRFACVQKCFLIRCTRATNLRGLGTPAGMLGSPKGSPKFLFGRPTLRSGRLK